MANSQEKKFSLEINLRWIRLVLENYHPGWIIGGSAAVMAVGAVGIALYKL